jgi:type I restriction enzyme, S subunit
MSFGRYPKYKDSGVEWLGEVPEHWDVVPLKRLATFTNGSAFKPTEWAESGYPIIRIENLNGSDNFNYFDGDADERHLIHDGDLLFGWSGNRGTSFGPYRWSRREVCVLNQHIFKVESDRTGIDPLYWTLKAVTTHVEDQAHGIIGMVHITKGDLGAINVPVASPVEQNAIAAFLDRETGKIDALIAEQRRLIELLQEKRQAVISHAVTKGLNPNAPMKDSGNKWLGNVPEHWDVMRIKHVKSDNKNAFVDGPFGSNLKSEHFIEDGDAYVIESGFATQGRLDVADLKTVSLEHFKTICRSETKGGDIIIAKIGAQFGKSSILPTLDKPAVVSGNSLKLTINPQRCDVKFVNWHLTSLKQLGAIDDIVNGTAQPALSLGEMNNLPMLVPQLDEQHAIVEFLETQLQEFDVLTVEAEHAISLLQERRSALISAAVTGHIDVRHLAETGAA